MNNKFNHLILKVLKQEYQYSLFKSNTDAKSIFELLKTIKEPLGVFLSENEFSMIAPVNKNLEMFSDKIEAGWNCLQIIGEMPFGTVQGLIASISNVLYSGGLGVCIVSTFSTDWFFIRMKEQQLAIELLQKDGWLIEKE